MNKLRARHWTWNSFRWIGVASVATPAVGSTISPIHLDFNGKAKAAVQLKGQGWQGILGGFEGFVAQWTGLVGAHAAHGVTRTTLSVEDKAWMLERLTGQDVMKSAIEAAHFGAVNPGNNRAWNGAYVNAQWQGFVQREALAFAIQAETRDWLKGVYYSLSLDRFVATDGEALRSSLGSIAAIEDANAAALAAGVLARFKADGIDLAGLQPVLANARYADLYAAALDFTGEHAQLMAAPGSFALLGEGGGFLVGTPGVDSVSGGAGGANDGMWEIAA